MAARRKSDIAAAAPELPGLEGVREEFGLTELPEGASRLAPKELAFVQHLLRTGAKAKSAVAAGYAPTSAGQIASELLAKPHVAGFYRRCLERLGADTRAALSRVEARARMFHAQALEAAEGSDEERRLAGLALDHDKTLLSANGKTRVELSGEVGGALPVALGTALTRIREEELRHER